MSDIATQRLRDREQLIQEITQAPDDLVQAVLEFLYFYWITNQLSQGNFEKSSHN